MPACGAFTPICLMGDMAWRCCEEHAAPQHRKAFFSPFVQNWSICFAQKRRHAQGRFNIPLPVVPNWVIERRHPIGPCTRAALGLVGKPTHFPLCGMCHI